MISGSPVFIDPVGDLGSLLPEIDKPSRYTGGEYGRLASKEAIFQSLIAFPDLYEIGMCNQALRIIYNNLNRIQGISCDRAFAPAPDFEKLLRDKNLPLYGLDTGISLKSLDLLLFTIGYELGISGVLAMLDVSGIPLRCRDRNDDFPLIIAGGPAVSNPLPYSSFIDAFWIGEAEAGFFDLARELLEIKQNGGGKTAMFGRVREHPNIWFRGKEKTYRAVDSGFSQREDPPAVFPVPGMKTVQHHGMLEIMRGCPNGCRFCHAGYWYRPMRQKKPETVIREANEFITLGGYREISLSSLSSGDYTGIAELVDALNMRFSGRHVSFQMPSLKVSTFSLSLLEKISQTRKSGLTFAVETPLDFWQFAINKQVTEDSVTQILREAKRNGWKGAKFYFMIGLPLPQKQDVNGEDFREETEIVNFINAIAKKTAMHFNINVGIFVPKPHTPYQWAQQIDSTAAGEKLLFIRSRLKQQGHKVSISDPLLSVLEGILSRGDERAGDLAEQAFLAGSRLDAWQEYINRDAWLEILEKNSSLAGEFLSEKNPEMPLPWQPIHCGVSPVYLRNEFEKSNAGELTERCAEKCTAPCGICGKNISIESSSVPHSTFHIPHSSFPTYDKPVPDPAVWRLLFSFTKEGSAVFHGHLSLIEIFSMAMCRAGLEVLYTQGFNPLAKLEIVAPLSVGISAGSEIAAVDFSGEFSPAEFTARMNNALPDGIRVTGAECYCIPAGGKKYSLSSLLWGFGYAGTDGMMEYVPVKEEKAYRQKILDTGAGIFSIRRSCVLAKNIPAGDNDTWASFFDVYRYLYGGK